MAGFPTWVGCGQAAGPQPERGFCEPNPAPFPIRPKVSLAPTLPALHVEGTRVVDEDGQPVALRGINFGSWLLIESWISGIGLMDEGDLLDALDAKAAELGVAELLAAARQANLLDWMTEAKSHHACVQQWREHTRENANGDQREAVEALWAWFDTQPWVFEEESLWRWLDGRFGHRRSQQLRAVYADHYVTDLDVERFAELGLNLIRVPVWFDALETDYLGENDFKIEGFERLAALADQAREQGVYLMLDLHGAPGGQSTAWHQGLTDGGHLWTDERCIAKTERLWQALASYFAGDPHVAVYDLLNEPMNAPGTEVYGQVHDRLYRAVRAGDPDTIVMLEDGYRARSQLVSPVELGWDNVMYSIHLYPSAQSAEDYAASIEGSLIGLGQIYDRFQVPLFLGEFNPADAAGSDPWTVDGMDGTLAMLDRRGVHWASWTWKYASPESLWGLYRPTGPQVRIDVGQASFERLREDFEALHSRNYAPHPGMAAVYRARAGDPVADLDLTP